MTVCPVTPDESPATVDNWPLIARVYRIGADCMFVQHGDICKVSDVHQAIRNIGNFDSEYRIWLL